MNNNNKLEAFLEIAIVLNEKLASVPILYGSLGLVKAIEKDLKTDDIDLLVEDHIFSKHLNQIRTLMKGMGFELIDPKENIFSRGLLKVGISDDGDMIKFSSVNPSELAVVDSSAKYRVMNAQDYLQTYKDPSLDGYRRDTKQKNDDAKIKLLEYFLSAK